MIKCSQFLLGSHNCQDFIVDSTGGIKMDELKIGSQARS